MAIQFEFYESPDPSGEKETKYHARAVTIQIADTDQICREIQSATSLTAADVRGVLTALSNSIASHLENSDRVHLDGIGYFKPTLRVTREVDPKKTRAQSVWFKSVSFRADIKLRKQLAGALTERAFIRNHSAKLTNEQIDNKIYTFLDTHDFITRREVQDICKLTKITASRHLKRMIDEGKIKNRHTPRNPLYIRVE